MTKFEIDPGYLEKYRDAAWMETYTGRQWWLGNPRVEDVTIFDIAHSLAFKCRYNGHSAVYYSVAEHCTTLALYARHMGHPVDVQFQLLMHDGSEAYLPDVPRPVKHHFPELIMMEKVHDAIVREWCGLSHDVPPIVKEWDSRIIRDERSQVLLPSGHKWQVDHLEPLNVKLHSQEPKEAIARFLQAYQVIGAEYHGKPVLCAYDPGEFAQGSYDTKVVHPEVRMVDFRGGCAMTIDNDGRLKFLHGNWDIFTPGF